MHQSGGQARDTALRLKNKIKNKISVAAVFINMLSTRSLQHFSRCFPNDIFDGVSHCGALLHMRVREQDKQGAFLQVLLFILGWKLSSFNRDY